MTDNEIIEALVLCSDTASRCDECNYYGEGNFITPCSECLMRDAYKLINRQKAEIERLDKLNTSVFTEKVMLQKQLEEIGEELKKRAGKNLGKKSGPFF